MGSRKGVQRRCRQARWRSPHALQRYRISSSLFQRLFFCGSSARDEGVRPARLSPLRKKEARDRYSWTLALQFRLEALAKLRASFLRCGKSPADRAAAPDPQIYRAQVADPRPAMLAAWPREGAGCLEFRVGVLFPVHQRGGGDVWQSLVTAQFIFLLVLSRLQPLLRMQTASILNHQDRFEPHFTSNTRQ